MRVDKKYCQIGNRDEWNDEVICVFDEPEPTGVSVEISQQGPSGPPGPPGPKGETGKPGTTSWNGITDRPDVFTKTEADGRYLQKTDKIDAYTKAETDEKFATKAEVSAKADKDETERKLTEKADKTTTERAIAGKTSVVLKQWEE